MNMKKGLVVFGLVITAVLMGCGGGNSTAGGATTAAVASGPKYKFGIIVQATSGDFTSEFKRGAEAAAARLNVTVNVMGPEQQIITEEVAMVENAVESGYDGLAVVAGDATGFQKARDLCAQRGIPFVTFNMDDGGNPPGVHPGYGTGYSGADEYVLAQLFAEKFFTDVARNAQTYIIATADSGLHGCVTRAYALKVVAAKYGKTLVTTVDIGYDFSNGYTVVENTIQANPNIQAIVGTDHFSQSIANVVQAQGLNDKIYVGCFDLLPGTIEMLSTGACDLIVGQNPYLQSYYAVLNLFTLKEDGICAYNINTGAELYTVDMAALAKERYPSR
jgi:ABC-type sugar transport system substrate-binding protein